MPRRPYKKQVADADHSYHSFEVSKLVNKIMRDGKKSVAENIVYSVLDHIASQKLNPVDVLNKAIQNAAPQMEVRPRRVGGASYLVPVETRPQRRLFLSLNWIIAAARARANKQYHTFAEKLYAELVDAYQNQGGAVEKKVQAEKLAESNKAFAHFKW